MSDGNYLDTFEEDNGTALQEVMRLVDALQQAERRVEDCEEKLAQFKTQERMLREQVLPQYMAEHRLSLLKLDNGKTVEIKDELSASIPKDETKRKAAIAFLMANEGGEIVKEEVSFTDPDEEILAALKEKGIAYDRQISVNANSLKAYFRRMLGFTKNSVVRIDQKEVPPELNLYVYKTTKIS